MYQVPEEAPVNPFAMPQGLMMLAQAQRVPAGMQKQIIENDPNLYGNPIQPVNQPQGGGYKTGSDFVYKPKTNAEIEEFRRKAMEEASRNRRR
jgi:hypothetical protein